MTLICRFLAAAGCTLWFTAAALGQQAAAPAPKVFPFSNPYGRSFQWLNNPQIQEEIRLTDDQWDRIKQAQEEMSHKVQELYQSRELNKGDVQKRQQAYRERIQALSDEAENKSRAILSKEQTVRLKQIIRQMQMRWGSQGIAGVLLEKDVVTGLELTEEQRQELRRKQAEIQQESVRKTREFYRRLQDEAREKLFGVLTADQRQKLETLLGPKFEIKSGAEGERKPGAAEEEAKPGR